ncbi:3-alpha-hydroxysteroid dehydrogenase/carbonyl reductase [Shimia sp. SK013]|uniref:SDR family oxidoreductase n=1 Tax=Shimia sp. SK013 TaxID=1389006 RepID=UPI0006B41001|nr:SDR family oxidoreductase [Shimia sp. SK013]KPA21652.1 3-alpha-hydroxysteroid dehydrogenase/carbonyl reductase [Shimia sp. SK013]
MRVALTGGATGIGAQVAEKLRAGGHEVTAFDISEPTAAVDRWIQTDLSDPASIAAAIAEATGPFDALINNAGLPPREGLEEKILQVNYFGLKAFLDGMLDKLAPGAAIVNTASRAGAMWRQNLDEVKALMALSPGEVSEFMADRSMGATRAYNLSKEAVIVLTMAETETMIARGIRMNSVSPAAVSTGILDDFVAAFGEKVAQNIARVGRPGLPEEVADVILFLISPQSNWLRGTDIVIDGGMGALAQTDMLGLK